MKLHVLSVFCVVLSTPALAQQCLPTCSRATAAAEHDPHLLCGGAPERDIVREAAEDTRMQPSMLACFSGRVQKCDGFHGVTVVRVQGGSDPRMPLPVQGTP